MGDVSLNRSVKAEPAAGGCAQVLKQALKISCLFFGSYSFTLHIVVLLCI
jgi:hypothetical protein